MLRVVAAFTCVVTLAACGTSAGQTGVSAVVTVYPLAWLAEHIAPDARVTYLASEGQDPHDMELTPQQRADVESATVVAYLGDIGFQPQVEQAIASARGQVVDASELMPADLLEHDPHFWFDPDLVVAVAEGMGDAFAKADPPNATVYRDNAERVGEELRQLDADLASTLQDCQLSEVIVGHEAYAYLLQPHGLDQEGISPPGGHGEATPARIAELVEKIRAEDIPAVLSEPVEGRADAEAVATEAGVKVVEILSLDIVTSEQGAEGLPALVLQQAEAVAEAADCT